MKFYAYRYRDIDGPTWGPLEQVADRTAKRRDVPTIDVDEFMYMGQLQSLDDRPDMHLYKHFWTRWYLNVDDELQYYVYLCGEEDKPFFETTVYYRRLGSLRDAVNRLELDLRARTPWSGDTATPNNVVPLRRASRGRGSIA